jgi:Photoprotection regulator fluorescence recovery protein
MSNVRPRNLKPWLLHHRKAKIMADFKWKDSEKKIANRAFEKARIAELDEIIQSFKTDAAKISDPDQLWVLVDSMKNKRYEFEQKYDYRYSVLITVLARLLAERRISTDDLARLDEDKLAAIVARADFFAS